MTNLVFYLLFLTTCPSTTTTYALSTNTTTLPSTIVTTTTTEMTTTTNTTTAISASTDTTRALVSEKIFESGMDWIIPNEMASKSLLDYVDLPVNFGVDFEVMFVSSSIGCPLTIGQTSWSYNILNDQNVMLPEIWLDAHHNFIEITLSSNYTKYDANYAYILAYSKDKFIINKIYKFSMTASETNYQLFFNGEILFNCSPKKEILENLGQIDDGLWQCELSEDMVESYSDIEYYDEDGNKVTDGWKFTPRKLENTAVLAGSSYDDNSKLGNSYDDIRVRNITIYNL